MKKYLAIFENYSEYELFCQSEDYVTPNVSLCIQENIMQYNPIDNRIDLTKLTDSSYNYYDNSDFSKKSYISSLINQFTENNSIKSATFTAKKLNDDSNNQNTDEYGNIILTEIINDQYDKDNYHYTYINIVNSILLDQRDNNYNYHYVKPLSYTDYILNKVKNDQNNNNIYTYTAPLNINKYTLNNIMKDQNNYNIYDYSINNNNNNSIDDETAK